jgi:prophage antirepressor-like protein
MNDLQIFKNDEFGEVRTVEKDGQIYFVGKDVAEALGYKDSSDSLKRHVDEDDKGVGEIPTPGGMQNMIVINESGLYSLVLSSKLEGAKKFKRWVTNEILPSIRKNGAYMTEDTLEKALSSPEFLIKLATTLKEEKEARFKAELLNKQQTQIIGELRAKADYVDDILKNKGLVTISQIAKDYGMSGNTMNKILHELGIQYKQSNQWLLYSKHHSKGYTHSETINFKHKDGRADVAMNTKWTQKGRLFIYEMLKRKGKLPIIECNN